jgi:hypothetical protein
MYVDLFIVTANAIPARKAYLGEVRELLCRLTQAKILRTLFSQCSYPISAIITLMLLLLHLAYHLYITLVAMELIMCFRSILNRSKKELYPGEAAQLNELAALLITFNAGTILDPLPKAFASEVATKRDKYIALARDIMKKPAGTESSIEPSVWRVCDLCRRTREEARFEEGQKMKLCGACKVARYCSVACQKAHWAEHQLVCSRRQSQ